MTKRKCNKCGKMTPIEDFLYKRGKDGGRVANGRKCGDCRREYQSQWRLKNKERVRAYRREADLKRMYGISVADYDAMLVAQNGRCAVCGSEDPGGRGNFCVDHCHATDGVRSLLCTQCNSMLGMGRDDPAILRQGASYLERHRSGLGIPT